MSRIENAFKNKKAFIGFLVAGDPYLEKTVEYILELEKAGASLIQIGIPFSDPIAEGVVVQEANIRALSKNMTTDKVFQIVKEVRKTSDIPICLMTYLNPVFHYGYDKFFKKCQEAGVDGIIIPDCPFEESKEVSDICYKYDVDLISIIAPTSKERILEITKRAKGFIYLVSSMDTIETVASTVKEIKTITDLPVVTDFEINDQEQIKYFSNFADGMIVGSAIVNIIKEYGEKANKPLYDHVKSLTEVM
ncbi:tryptophan synthase subunit alpha [Thomasclavelia cocleata]|uniref:Tryptophan synthase alpha chain n=2 Tax=Thomasclavelia cocleata TaxID=69824 RepID=A0A1I0DLS6_9FIRM|nr:tryptophan synthase subunit alpha [Thomasclavelia cocleata]MCI9631507.1 tryptophan synthase subunit alpha [Thomasclavelia cocleata]MCR1961260.1 tryptophan synthase subunit alpha [Thomasclavelia cocleata]NDO42688.1 tryptophan synthase subunit alpha [Thomasclavelia cocleata]SET32643.1 tryptophan synthase, alpha chain [Thomasclavelia cocleata]